MKKILLVVFVLASAMAYSQEIRVPDEKRDNYSNDRNGKDVKERTTMSPEQQKERDKQAIQRREEAVRKNKEAAMRNAAMPIYCIIQEISTPGKPGKERVSVIQATEEESLKNLDQRKMERMKDTMHRKKEHRSGLDAVQYFLGAGWTLENTSVYSLNNETVREYLMKM